MNRALLATIISAPTPPAGATWWAGMTAAETGNAPLSNVALIPNMAIGGAVNNATAAGAAQPTQLEKSIQFVTDDSLTLATPVSFGQTSLVGVCIYIDNTTTHNYVLSNTSVIDTGVFAGGGWGLIGIRNGGPLNSPDTSGSYSLIGNWYRVIISHSSGVWINGVSYAYTRREVDVSATLSLSLIAANPTSSRRVNGKINFLGVWPSLDTAGIAQLNTYLAYRARGLT